MKTFFIVHSQIVFIVCHPTPPSISSPAAVVSGSIWKESCGRVQHSKSCWRKDSACLSGAVPCYLLFIPQNCRAERILKCGKVQSLWSWKILLFNVSKLTPWVPLIEIQMRNRWMRDKIFETPALCTLFYSRNTHLVTNANVWFVKSSNLYIIMQWKTFFCKRRKFSFKTCVYLGFQISFL